MPGCGLQGISRGNCGPDSVAAALENLDKPVIAWTNRSDAAIESDGQLSSGEACPAFALAVGARRGARVLDKNNLGAKLG